mmetsp:Transcript_22240/g.74819  ORF Transcript_22240/g.74819 Transcript_22240/m.74819 type:complete len:404 (+) Transcript_22240:154-1365(+)
MAAAALIRAHIACDIMGGPRWWAGCGAPAACGLLSPGGPGPTGRDALSGSSLVVTVIALRTVGLIVIIFVVRRAVLGVGLVLVGWMRVVVALGVVVARAGGRPTGVSSAGDAEPIALSRRRRRRRGVALAATSIVSGLRVGAPGIGGHRWRRRRGLRPTAAAEPGPKDAAAAVLPLAVRPPLRLLVLAVPGRLAHTLGIRRDGPEVAPLARRFAVAPLHAAARSTTTHHQVVGPAHLPATRECGRRDHFLLLLGNHGAALFEALRCLLDVLAEMREGEELLLPRGDLLRGEHVELGAGLLRLDHLLLEDLPLLLVLELDVLEALDHVLLGLVPVVAAPGLQSLCVLYLEVDIALKSAVDRADTRVGEEVRKLRHHGGELVALLLHLLGELLLVLDDLLQLVAV